MTIEKILSKAITAGKQIVLDNLDIVAEKIGDTNPFGDETLLLDKKAEEATIQVLETSGMSFAVMSEEVGVIIPSNNPDYLAIIDPIDGSANLERGIPLCSIGISAIPFSDKMSTNDVEISLVDSFFTEELYIARKGRGVTLNGKQVKPSTVSNPDKSIISYDTKKKWHGKFAEGSQRTLVGIYDFRRTGSNLLDLCWTASGALEGMVDLRDILPIVHVCGTHMVLEAGGVVLDNNGDDFVLPIEFEQRMSFIAAGSRELAERIFRFYKGF